MLPELQRRKQLSLWAILQQQRALVGSKRNFCLWIFFSMNLNTAVLKGVFVHFLLQYNESNQTVRAAENQWQDSFQRSLIYRPRFFFYSREALCGDGECYKSEGGDKCQGCTRGTLWGAAVPICGEHLIGWLACFSPACIEKKDEMWERWWETGQMVLKRAFQTTHAAFTIHQILASCPQEVLWEPAHHVGAATVNRLTSIFVG